MDTKKIVSWLSTAFFLALAMGASVEAEDWRSLAQPIGALLVVESASTVNGRLGGIPPFDVATDVTTIRTSTPQYFVRFYNPSAAENPSNAIGSWVMRSATVRGLTPAQVRDIFALPSMPTMMTVVLVPTDSRLYTGIAAPIPGWGAGGAQQSKLIGPPWVPGGNFINQQAIGECILCYRVLAGQGNENRVAAYLDHRVPAAYTDLEYVYTSLDLLYYGPTAAQFRQALVQISPLRYDNLASDALRSNVMFNDVIDQRLGALLQLDGKSASPPPEGGRQGKDVWVQLAGGEQRAGDLGFNSRTRAILAGVDARPSAETLFGLTIGFIQSDLDWSGGLGGVSTDYARLGAYALRRSGNWFIQGGLNAGASSGDARRLLAFAAPTRSATATIDGWDGNARVRIGYHLPVAGVDITPVAGLDYFHQYRDGFSENGANSLNLRVLPVTNRTLRSHVGIDVSWDGKRDSATVVTPRFGLGWAHVRPLDERAISAGLEGQPDRFTVYDDTKSTKALTAGAGISLASGKDMFLFVRYDLEYRRDVTDYGFSAGVNYRF